MAIVTCISILTNRKTKKFSVVEKYDFIIFLTYIFKQIFAGIMKMNDLINKNQAQHFTFCILLFNSDQAGVLEIFIYFAP